MSQPNPLGSYLAGTALSHEPPQQCNRCGLCLAVCPTYRETGLETQSPRGRLALIAAVAEGVLAPGEAFKAHLYHCLDCRACQSICPAGVRPGEMVVAARARHNDGRYPPLVSFLLNSLLPQPERLERWAARLRALQRLGLSGALGLLPGGWGELSHLLPPLPGRSLRRSLPEVVPARGEMKHRVGFFLGCVMSLVFPQASRATVRLLHENGCEVVTPKDEVCCGALHLAWGDEEGARRLARHNIEAFERAGVEAIVTDCAACGAAGKEYHRLLADDPAFAERASLFSERMQDVTQFLVALPPKKPTNPTSRRVTYHDPCHLVHAQGVSREPRELLETISGLELVPLAEADSCCGGAGNYVLSHPSTSRSILERKMSHIAASSAQVVATANPGCLLQLRLGAKRAQLGIEVVHLTELLAQGYGEA